jgi:tetratricopeptide (TPR) repeat protein
MSDYFDEPESFGDVEDIEVSLLVNRFENMLKHEKPVFFDVYEFVDIIDYYLESDNTEKSRLALQYAIDLHPASDTLKLRQAMHYAYQNEKDKALHILKSINPSSDKESELIFTRANIFSRLKMHHNSVREFQKLIHVWDDPSEIYMNIAYEYENSGDYLKAIQCLKSAIKKNIICDSMLYELGYCFEMLNKKEEAIDFFQKYIDSNPYSEVAWVNLAIAFSNTGQFEKAIEANDYAIAIDDNFASAYYNKAFALKELKCYNQAAETFKELIAVQYQDAMVYYNIGECYEKEGNWNNAILYYNKALELDEFFAEAWAGLGCVYEEIGNNPKALLYTQKAVEVEPNNDGYWYILGYIQMKMAQYEQA